MLIAILGVLGLCFGSFVEALVWRVRQQGLPRKKRAATDAQLSMLRGRSMCPHCKHTLSAIDLIPLVSWLTLRGKCRYCRHPIGLQPVLLELAMAASFVCSYVLWPIAFDERGIVAFVVWLVVLVGLVALFVYDLRWQLLPDKIVWPLVAVTAVWRIADTALYGTWGQVVQAGIAVLIIAGLFYVLHRVSEGKWIGFGDVKLALALGLLAGTPSHALLLLFLASLLGTLVALPGLLTKKLARTSVLPFGPFLIGATVIVQLLGTAIIDWYMNGLLIY